MRLSKHLFCAVASRPGVNSRVILRFVLNCTIAGVCCVLVGTRRLRRPCKNTLIGRRDDPQFCSVSRENSVERRASNILGRRMPALPSVPSGIFPIGRRQRGLACSTLGTQHGRPVRRRVQRGSPGDRRPLRMGGRSCCVPFSSMWWRRWRNWHFPPDVRWRTSRRKRLSATACWRVQRSRLTGSTATTGPSRRARLRSAIGHRPSTPASLLRRVMWRHRPRTAAFAAGHIPSSLKCFLTSWDAAFCRAVAITL